MVDKNTLIALYLKTFRLTLSEPIRLRAIAYEIHTHESYLSKLENGKYVSQSLLITLLKYYQLMNISDDKGNSLIYEKNNYLVLSENLNEIINDYITKKTSIMTADVYNLIGVSDNLIFDRYQLFFPYELLHQYLCITFTALNNHNKNDYVELEKILLATIHLFNIDAQILFNLAQSYKYHMMGQYNLSKQIVDKILSDHLLDLRIEIICKYYLLLFNIIVHDYIKAIELRNELVILFKKEPNKLREIKLIGTTSQIYSSINAFDKSIQINKYGMKLAKDFNNTQYAIFSYNLGQNFSIQCKYQEAIKYYSIAIKIIPDNTSCFELAWCYYNEGDYSNSLKYINKARENGMPIYKEYSTLFCEWLEIMIQTPYYKKCETILLKILNKFGETIHPQSRVFLYKQLLNYYLEKKNTKYALKYSLLLNEL